MPIQKEYWYIQEWIMLRYGVHRITAIDLINSLGIEFWYGHIKRVHKERSKKNKK